MTFRNRLFHSTALTLVFIALSSTNALAGIGVTAKAGTLGVGADVTVSLMPRLNLRIAGQAGRLTLEDLHDAAGTETTEITDLDAELDLQSYGVMVDLHPFGGPFRLTGGVLHNQNEFSVSARTGEILDIGNNQYAIESLNGSLSFQEVAAYLGIGFGNAASEDSHWHFAMDAGLLFHGAPEVSLSGSTSSAALDALLAVDLELEEQDIEDELSDFRIYPVLSLGISYAF